MMQCHVSACDDIETPEMVGTFSVSLVELGDLLQFVKREEKCLLNILLIQEQINQELILLIACPKEKLLNFITFW